MSGKSNFTEWSFQLYDVRKDKAIDDDSGILNVLTENDPAEVTIYADGNGTAGSNPATMTDGRCTFFTASTVTAVDITFQTANGFAGFAESAAPSDHRLNVYTEAPAGLYQLIIPYTFSGASELVVDTGFDILDNMFIKDCWVHVTTAGTGFALTVGTSTATTGFANAVVVTTTGYPTSLLEEAAVSTSGLMGTLISYTTGTFARKIHHRANATSGANIVYSNTTSSTTAGAGYIYLTYHRAPA